VKKKKTEKIFVVWKKNDAQRAQFYVDLRKKKKRKKNDQRHEEKKGSNLMFLLLWAMNHQHKYIRGEKRTSFL
jgi:hypothetical protein